MATANLHAVVKVEHRLEYMIKLQREFQTFLNNGAAPIDLSPEAKMDFIRTNVLALENELHEAMGETGWKPWASSNHINREAFVGELVDAWHLFMNLMLVVEMTPDELFQGYITKQAINRKRQQDGYDGVTTKCPRCKRAYDDKAVACTPPRTNSDALQEATPAYCHMTNQCVSPSGDMLTPGPTGWYVA